MGPGPIYSHPFILKASLSSPPESNHARSAFLTVFHHTTLAKQGIRQIRTASMSEQRELRSRREERMENGVKNLKGAKLFPQTYALKKKMGPGPIFSIIPIMIACQVVQINHRDSSSIRSLIRCRCSQRL